MSETQLRDLLVDVAEQVDVVDLLPRLEGRLRRRRRRHTVSAAVGAAVVIAGVAYGATQVVSGEPPSNRSPMVSPSPSSSRQSTTSVTPRFLPAGATLIRTGPLMPRPGAHPGGRQHPAIVSSYGLAGAQNANTMPHRSLSTAEATDPRHHPATTLEITFVPRQAFQGRLHGSQLSTLRQVLPPAQKRFGFTRQQVTVAGNAALVTLDDRLGGAFRIDWIDPAGYHSVECDRIITERGLSGLRLKVLLRVAKSLYES